MSIRLNNTDVESKVNVRERQSKGVYILADNPNLYEVQRLLLKLEEETT